MAWHKISLNVRAKRNKLSMITRIHFFEEMCSLVLSCGPSVFSLHLDLIAGFTADMIYVLAA